jgi:hypothetical protein
MNLSRTGRQPARNRRATDRLHFAVLRRVGALTLRWAVMRTAHDEIPVNIAIVPRPLGLTLGRAEATGCELSDGLVISYAPELVGEARWFREVLQEGTGWLVHLAPLGTTPVATIELTLASHIDLPTDIANVLDARARAASYRLISLAGRLVITSPGAEGTFHALQTLRQLLPDSTFGRASRAESISIPE